MTERRRFLPDGLDWWAQPTPWLPLFDEAIEAAGFEGIELAAPSRVVLSDCDSFPVFVCQRAPYADLPHTSFGANGCVVAVDLLGHHVFAGPAAIYDNVVQEDLPDALMRDPLGGEKRPPLGTSTQSTRVELREMLGLPWTPTRYLLTALVCDRVSNRVESELALGAFRDDAVDRFLAEQRDAEPPSAPWPVRDPYASPPRDLPSFERVRGLTPPVPDDIGITLSARGTAIACAFRLPLAAREIVREKTASTFDQSLFPSVRVAEAASPTAVVDVALVLTTADGPVPTLLRVAVPVYEALDRENAPVVVTGCFALDLDATPGVGRTHRELYVHAFADRVIAGPLTVRRAG